MGTKNFKKGFDSLLSGSAETPKGKRGRPRKNFKEVSKTSELGTKENETRATFIVSKHQLEKLKAVAYWERTSIKDILGEALTEYLGRKKGLSEAVSAYGKKSKARSAS